MRMRRIDCIPNRTHHIILYKHTQSLIEYNYLPSVPLGNSKGNFCRFKKEISLDRIACPCKKIDSELISCSKREWPDPNLTGHFDKMIAVDTRPVPASVNLALENR